MESSLMCFLACITFRLRSSSSHKKWWNKLQNYAETSYEGEPSYTKIPYVSRDKVYSPGKYRGLGMKNLNMWIRAYVAKLVWAIVKKRDNLWIHWIRGRYIKARELWDYTQHVTQVDYPKENYKDIWSKVLTDWGISLKVEGSDQCINSLKKLQLAR
ncbi:LOW QUALITY PROTEIN: hypothetical protein Cgig2_023874 [Carnegiea gigantea]|uniref:Uncharacterized protein n=1 Tax=Carnegiea gigantea TaxID=171969 RepID=A0A9Q1JFN0_9CARY|nr:LOW QUALITY PROTEIN: hypothetical protein Cgig2_023874 [Carnegiea gigantea]